MEIKKLRKSFVGIRGKIRQEQNAEELFKSKIFYLINK
jgi:hypothetical protein